MARKFPYFKTRFDCIGFGYWFCFICICGGICYPIWPTKHRLLYLLSCPHKTGPQRDVLEYPWGYSSPTRADFSDLLWKWWRNKWLISCYPRTEANVNNSLKGTDGGILLPKHVNIHARKRKACFCLGSDNNKSKRISKALNRIWETLDFHWFIFRLVC